MKPALGSSNGRYISHAIDGQSSGERFVRDLNDCSAPDALYQAVVALLDEDDPSRAKLRGFCRGLTKAMQRAVERPQEAITADDLGRAFQAAQPIASRFMAGVKSGPEFEKALTTAVYELAPRPLVQQAFAWMVRHSREQAKG